MSIEHSSQFTVRHYECDAYGHLNNAVYMQYMREAAINASAAAGLDRTEYRRLGRTWLIRATELECHADVKFGDQVQFDTWVASVRRTISRRMYSMRRPTGMHKVESLPSGKVSVEGYSVSSMDEFYKTIDKNTSWIKQSKGDRLVALINFRQ